jgi:hypothetical protein
MFNNNLTKSFILLLILCVSSAVKAESLAYFKAFFDREEEITHDPEYPEYEYVNPKNDIYQMKKTGANTGIGLAINLSLSESGKYAFWLLKIDHRWKNNSREIRFGKCKAYNGKWHYKEGKLFLGNDVVLEAAYVDGLNMMKATFLDAKRPQGTEGLDIFLNDGSIDTLLGLQPNADDGYRCGGFSLPFWLPIPGERPW